MTHGIIIHRKGGVTHATHQFDSNAGALSALREIVRHSRFEAIDFEKAIAAEADVSSVTRVINNHLDGTGQEVEVLPISLPSYKVIVIRDAEGLNPCAFRTTGAPVEVELLDYSDKGCPEGDRKILECASAHMEVAKEFR